MAWSQPPGYPATTSEERSIRIIRRARPCYDYGAGPLRQRHDGGMSAWRTCPPLRPGDVIVIGADSHVICGELPGDRERIDLDPDLRPA